MVMSVGSLSTYGASSAESLKLIKNQASTRVAPGTLTPQQQQRVQALQQVDRAVRQHEAAHIAAGAGVVISGPNYNYTYGPDGKAYAVSGEVGIDTSAEDKPEANIDKGVRIQKAALAPRDPSPQDYRVAAAGAELESTGRYDLAQQQRELNAAAQEKVRQVYGEASPRTEPKTSPGLSDFA